MHTKLLCKARGVLEKCWHFLLIILQTFSDKIFWGNSRALPMFAESSKGYILSFFKSFHPAASLWKTKSDDLLFSFLYLFSLSFKCIAQQQLFLSLQRRVKLYCSVIYINSPSFPAAATFSSQYWKRWYYTFATRKLSVFASLRISNFEGVRPEQNITQDWTWHSWL